MENHTTRGKAASNVTTNVIKAPFARALRSATQFRRNNDGSLTLFSMFMFVIMLLVSGMAVDVMHLETQRTRVQYAADRAILAAASLEQDLDPELVVRNYFETSGLGNIDLVIDHETISSGGQRNYRRVSLETGVSIDTSFMGLVGIETLSAPSASTAEEGITDVEISLVVDVSGSMGYNSATGNTKLYELQQAAKEFGYAMLCNPTDPNREQSCTVENGRVSLSIIPYEEQVDIGSDLASQFNLRADHDYNNCVDFTSDEFSQTAVSPSAELDRAGHINRYSTNLSSSSSRVCDDVWDNGQRAIQPLLSDYNDVDDFIDDLYATGSTSIDMGMKWGVALLDPAAQPAISALTSGDGAPIDSEYAQRPFAYGERNASKVIVLMTDGKHEGRGQLRSSKKSGPSVVWQDKTEGFLGIYNSQYDEWYSFVEDGYGNDKNVWLDFAPGTYEWDCWSYWSGGRKYKDCGYRTDKPKLQDENGDLNNTKQLSWPEVWMIKGTKWAKNYGALGRQNAHFTVQPSTQDTNLYNSCNAAKAEGMLIFTIGFEVHSDYLDVMRTCASTPNHFFDIDGTEISSTFATIASQINRLRLTQ
ncbi:Tad domain-containing protein [Halocynthiibacter sp. C4]|uniref:TadE/TadG family type IV pilus assembly protein n=1 Tax=Halocynthiibacter sp. C4 TaxID=2992758 RepID=UPI00237B7747|nr:Tad domain-containing protein [Halocynthiibacter sp. C4]MDE0589024.1 Tad domain-containing protein [Halocynthiibacter sp. C4]